VHLCIMQVVYPHHSSLFNTLRQDLQLTCLVLTVAIYSCSVAVITWPRHRSPVGCRRVMSHYGDRERIPWTGRSFDDDSGRFSSRSSSRQIARDIVTSVQVQKCQQQSSVAGEVVDTLTLTWCSLIVVIYLVYVVECWFSPYRRRFKDKRRRVVDTHAAYDLVTSLQTSLPVVRWTAVSFHYIRSVMVSANATTSLRRHKSYRQRVVTHRDTRFFRYSPSDLRDCSPPLVDLDAFPVTWLRISCQFSFGSAAARRDFARQRDAFYGANRTRDQHIDFRQTLSLLSTSGGAGGHVAWSRDMAVYNPNVRPWYTSVAIYWLASLLTLSWPLRIIIHWRTATVDYAIHKMFDFRSDDSDAMSRDGNDVISVTSLENDSSSDSSSVDSSSVGSEIGSLVADADCALAPSYSQAILMDTRTLTDHKTDQHRQRQQQRHKWRNRLRRVQSSLSVHHRHVIADVKPSTSLTMTHLSKSAVPTNDRSPTAAAAAILMTSRPPSYDTAMCLSSAHVT